MKALRNGWHASTLLALAACTAPDALVRFDELARTGPARTIVLEQDFSLYSPYDLHATREYVSLIAAQKAEVFALLGVESPAPIVVHLRETEGIGTSITVIGNQMRVDELTMEPHDGVLGWAGEELVVRVAPAQKIRLEDGREITGLLAASMYGNTLRHELVHFAARQAGLPREPWLNEGLAHALEWIPIDAGRFVLAPVPPCLSAAASLAPGPGVLDPLFAWQQAYPATDSDREARMLGLALVVFLLEREPAPLREGLRRVAALEREQLLALEPAWLAWLAGFAEDSSSAELDEQD